MNEQTIIGISSEDHKLASLFFEKIVPLNYEMDIPDAIKFPLSVSDPNLTKFRGERRSLIPTLLIPVTLDILKSRGHPDEERTKILLHKSEDIIASDIHNYLNTQGIPSIPIFHIQQSYDAYLPNGTKETVEISLMKIPVIDTSNVEWKHILDIRKDKDFRRKLRNFRLFLNENYQGKSPYYVRDSLEKKMEEYEDTCKKHGLQLMLSSISQTLDSKSILGYLGLVSVGILTGQQNIINTTIIGGTVIEIGKATIQVAQKHLEYLSSRENTELAYLIKLKKMFG